MKLIKQSCDLWGYAPMKPEEAILHLEKCTRVCYQSEGRIKEGSAAKLIQGAINQGHYSVLRHAYITLKKKFLQGREPNLSPLFGNFFNCAWEGDDEQPTDRPGVMYVTGNYQAWRDWLLAHCRAGNYTWPEGRDPEKIDVDEIYGGSVYESGEHGWEIVTNVLEVPESIRPITVLFHVSRATTHELVRHPLIGILQESQRYCAYRDVVEVVTPLFFDKLSDELQLYFINSLQTEISMYKAALRAPFSLAPQEARALLPNAVAAHIVMTAIVRDWKHFCFLRCSPKADPPMRLAAEDFRDQVAKQLQINL